MTGHVIKFSERIQLDIYTVADGQILKGSKHPKRHNSKSDKRIDIFDTLVTSAEWILHGYHSSVDTGESMDKEVWTTKERMA